MTGHAAAKMWNASRFCVSSLRRGHANLLCIVPILVYVLPKQVQIVFLVLRPGKSDVSDSQSAKTMHDEEHP